MSFVNRSENKVTLFRNQESVTSIFLQYLKQMCTSFDSVSGNASDIASYGRKITFARGILYIIGWRPANP